MSDLDSHVLGSDPETVLERVNGNEHRPLLDVSTPVVAREAIGLALAAADVCWLTPIYMALIWTRVQHVSLLLWLGILILMLGYFYYYRALVAANLSLRIQQGLLALGLLLSIALVLRFHTFSDPTQGLRSLTTVQLLPNTDPAVAVLSAWLTTMTLVAIWARAVHLANRSLSAESVGFSFRAGILLMTAAMFFVRFLTTNDMSVFVILYFFFALAAVALARVEQVSGSSTSIPTRFSGYWIGAAFGAVVVLITSGLGLVAFLQGGGLGRILRWLSPLLWLLQWIVVGLGALILMVVEWVLSLFSLDLGRLSQNLQQAFERLGLLLTSPPQQLPPADEAAANPVVLRILQAGLAIGLPTLIIALVLIATWRRHGASGRRQREDSMRESALSMRAVASGLQSAIRNSLDQLGRWVDSVGRISAARRFLTALSVRRIYANLVRLAAELGHPRTETETPYEYLPTLLRAFPDSAEEVNAITEAYVSAHYGLLPDSPEELLRIRTYWERIRVRSTPGQGQGEG